LRQNGKNKTVTQGKKNIANEDAATAMARSNLYGFLATVFRTEPTAELLGEIRKPPFQGALKAVGVDLTESLSEDSEKKLLDDLAVEYTRLFIGPGPHTTPYAAVYLGGDGASLWGPETVWVKRFIEDAGFDYKPDYPDLPDHIAVELEFMQEITSRETRALEEGNDGQAQTFQETEEIFLTQHMARWVPKFCDKIASRARLPFYREMAALTVDFILSEAEELASASSGFPLRNRR